MSRVGKKPIRVPAGTEVAISGRSIRVTGSQGELSLDWHPSMTVEYDGEAQAIQVTRPDDRRQHRALHGLTRSLINNMVIGVNQRFEKRLEIQGVGYQALFDDGSLVLHVGFANSVRLEVPDGVICELPDNTHIVVQSCDKQAAGQFAAEIRAVRPPEPYKGKGIRYADEHVRRKQGKTFAAAGG